VLVKRTNELEIFEAFVQLTADGMRRSICDAFFCRPIDNSLARESLSQFIALPFAPVT
jgi:hypothetical protein